MDVGLGAEARGGTRGETRDKARGLDVWLGAKTRALFSLFLSLNFVLFIIELSVKMVIS